MNEKWKLWTVGLVLVALVVAGCGSSGSTSPQAPATPIKVAMMAAVTGPYAASGRPIRAPVDMALEDYNKTAEVPIEVVFEDCGSDNSTAINGLNRLLESKPAALLSYCISPQFNAIAPTLDAEQLPTMLFSTVPGFYERGWNWIFGALPIATVEASAGLQYLREDMAKGRIALFVPNDDAGKAVAKSLEPTAQSLRIELIPAYFQSNDNDFSGNLAAARRNNPDAYMFYGAGNDTAKLLRQARQAGIEETVIGHMWAGKPFLNLLDPSEVEGAYTWASALPELSTDPKVQAFAKALKERADQEIDWIATSAYDSAMMMFIAVGKAGGERAKIIEALRATQGYQGLSGEFSFDAKGRGRFETNIVRIGPNKQIEILKTVKIKLD